MTNINNIIANLLKESTIDRNQILKAIDQKKILSVEKGKWNGENVSGSITSVTPINIDENNLVYGETKDGDEVTFKFEDILDDLSGLQEAIKFGTSADNNDYKIANQANQNKGVPVDLGSMDVSAAADTLKKADEADVDIMVNEDAGQANLAQNKAVENFEAWCKELQVKCGGQKTKGDILNYTLFINDKPAETFIEPEGDIKIGGHIVKDSNDFKNIVNFYGDNN